MNKKYGYFSTANAARHKESPFSDGKHHQQFIYLNPQGEEVVVTGVGYSPDPKAGGYHWADAVYVSEITTYVGSK